MKTLFLSFQIAIFLLMAAPVQAGSVKGTRSKTVIRNRSLGKVNPNSSTEKYNQAVEKNKQTGFWSAPTGQIAQSPGSNNNNGGGAGGFFSSTTTNTNARAQSKGSGKAQSSDGARSSDGFSRATSGGKGGSSKKTSNNVDIARSSPSVMAGASALNTYDNKCDAAAAGAEYKTNSFVPVYYQYEVLTTQARDPFSLADVIDKAFQEFLAAWIVDCDTVNMEDDDFLATIAAAANNNNNNGNFGGRRGRQLKMLEEFVFPRFHRKLQMTLAPIVGTGVAEPDIGKFTCFMCLNGLLFVLFDYCSDIK